MRYSQNHNLLRTVGFITMLCAVLTLADFSRFTVMSSPTPTPAKSPIQVRNLPKSGLLFAGPPCSTWVFLILGCKGVRVVQVGASKFWNLNICSHLGMVGLRSRGSTLRSWWDPEGCGSKAVVLSNILLMRLIYLLLGKLLL